MSICNVHTKDYGFATNLMKIKCANGCTITIRKVLAGGGGVSWAGEALKCYREQIHRPQKSPPMVCP